MILGIDTTFLVETAIREHPGHEAASARLTELLEKDAGFALAPQVIAEFIHVVTDPRRFARPLSITEALACAESWWAAREVQTVSPNAESLQQFQRWMAEFRLNRKRILDTRLAATYLSNGIDTILTSNVRDYQVFGCFRVVTPA